MTAAPELLDAHGPHAATCSPTRATTPTRSGASLREAGAIPVIPGRSQPQARKSATTSERYKDRHLIENAFCRLKDFRRVATRYDKLAANFLSAVALATARRVLAVNESSCNLWLLPRAG